MFYLPLYEVDFEGLAKDQFIVVLRMLNFVTDGLTPAEAEEQLTRLDPKLTALVYELNNKARAVNYARWNPAASREERITADTEGTVALKELTDAIILYKENHQIH